MSFRGEQGNVQRLRAMWEARAGQPVPVPPLQPPLQDLQDILPIGSFTYGGPQSVRRQTMSKRKVQIPNPIMAAQPISAVQGMPLVFSQIPQVPIQRANLVNPKRQRQQIQQIQTQAIPFSQVARFEQFGEPIFVEQGNLARPSIQQGVKRFPKTPTKHLPPVIMEYVPPVAQPQTFFGRIFGWAPAPVEDPYESFIAEEDTEYDPKKAAFVNRRLGIGYKAAKPR